MMEAKQQEPAKQQKPVGHLEEEDEFEEFETEGGSLGGDASPMFLSKQAVIPPAAASLASLLPRPGPDSLIWKATSVTHVLSPAGTSCSPQRCIYNSS